MSGETCDIDFRVRAYELGTAGCARLPVLLGYLQEAAALHARSLGFSHEEMSANSLFWVLTRLYLRLSPEAVARRWPGWRERVAVRTWPVCFERLQARRDFLLLDEQGRTMGAAVSSWVTLDTTARKLSPMPEELRQRIPVSDEHALEYQGRKTPGLEPAEQTGGMLMTAQRSDLDVNGHVNNAVLAAWALDEATTHLPPTARCTALEVAFRAEVLPGQSVLARSAPQGENVRLLGLFSADDGREHLRSASWWETVSAIGQP
ncbi:acyl-ACP thioesterase [Desulfocurvibacter africanus PCS]|uniref:Acyl-ACP thioesterase n=1 Tax=Desulfocurvibacter africanus PCS TaxID=1262666 RepID=M5PSE3_DESAF|nr:acyl-ACP thioesterase domain-containing protein [Desulfocurvibacter africanus]EMG37034.1 acyl-ACP thioesterase [Desulfocurvibacter africanus PCS]